MMKCPKCTFEQPEDIYCANCGVNMKNYRPDTGPFIKRFLSSWMGKIFLITLAIIGFLIYDLQKTKDAPDTTASQVARSQSTRSAKDYEAIGDSQGATAEIAPVAQRVSSADSRNFQKPAAKKVAPVSAAAVTNSAAAANEKPVGPPVLRVSFYSGSRGAIQDLQREATAAPSSGGEVMGGIVPLRKVSSMGAEFKSVGSSRYKVQDAQKPIIIYKGQRTADVKAGIYFQITALRQEANTLQIEVKSWGNIKPQEPDETYFTSEMTINSQQAAFIAGFLPRDKVFTEEDKALLEGDPTLKIYNQEDFIEGSSDLIMVIEMMQTP